MHQVIEFYEQNLRLSRQTGDQHGEMAALNSLGHAYGALDERDIAVQCFEQALQIAHQIGDLRSERQTLKNLDEVLKPAGEDAEINLPQKTRQTRKSSRPAKTNSTRNKPTQQRKPKSPRASKKPRQTKDQ